MTRANESLLSTLADAVGHRQVLIDADMRASYEIGWMRRWSGTSLCVVRPENTNQVAQVVKACVAAGVAIVPQGGNTGMVGGSVPGTQPSVILSLRRLDEIAEPDLVSGQIEVGAGVTLKRLQDRLVGTGWAFGVDLGARATATIGGMVATNAGGMRVVRHGMMRVQTAGVEVVLADGRILRSMRGLQKDNTGYDLVGLMCGSEGTLGIVTTVRLQLVPDRPHAVTALIGLDSLEDAVELVARVRLRLPSLEAAEYVSSASMALVRRHLRLPPPLPHDHGAYVLLECASTRDPMDELSEAVGDLPAVAVGMDRATREELWSYRENITESISAEGIPHKLDVAVPMGRLPEFEADIEAMLAARSERAVLYAFGHIADGNLHVNVVTQNGELDPAIDRAVLELVAAHGGSVSAEHGIGRAKAGYLGLTRSSEEIAAMAAIKRALDPQGLLNPGVIFPTEVPAT